MAHDVMVHEQFVEVTFSGDVTRGSVQAGPQLTDEHVAAIRRTLRVLFTFDGVKSFGFDPQQLGAGMAQLHAVGLRLAVAASDPLGFGFGRQIAQYSGVEGLSISIFRDRETAIAWLLGSKSRPD